MLSLLAVLFFSFQGVLNIGDYSKCDPPPAHWSGEVHSYPLVCLNQVNSTKPVERRTNLCPLSKTLCILHSPEVSLRFFLSFMEDRNSAEILQNVWRPRGWGSCVGSIHLQVWWMNHKLLVESWSANGICLWRQNGHMTRSHTACRFYRLLLDSLPETWYCESSRR